MKTIVQTVLILVVSLLVVGATYGVSQTDWASHQSFGRRPPDVERAQVDTTQPAASAERSAPSSAERHRPGGHHQNDRPLSLASLGSFIRILLPMALMIGGVGLVKRRGLRQQRAK